MTTRLPSTMRAIVIPRHGGPEVLTFVDVPIPVPGPDEVIVRVAATSLNRLDLWARSGPPGPIFPWPERSFPIISGCDCTGWIAALGAEVNGLQIGDAVIVYPAIYCGRCEYCLAGEQTQCLEYQIFGEQVPGAMAEYACVKSVSVLRLPVSADLVQAAVLPVAYTTAWRLLMSAGNLTAGDSVLVLGAGGGVGSAALQIASLAGATIFAGASSDERRGRAIELGAIDAVDSRSSFSERILELTSGRGVDIVVDPIGATWPESIRSLARGGSLVVCGATGGNRPEFDIRELYQRHRRIIGAPMGNWTEFRTVIELFLNGKLSPVIDSAFDLGDAANAHRRAESGASFGKIAIRVSGESAA